jgi:hypothetical protein
MTAPNPDIVAKIANLDFGVLTRHKGPLSKAVITGVMRRRDGTAPSQVELDALFAAGPAELDALRSLIQRGLEQDQWVSERIARVRELIEKYGGVQPGERVLADIRKRMNAEDGAEWDDLEETLVASTTEWHRNKST